MVRMRSGVRFSARARTQVMPTRPRADPSEAWSGEAHHSSAERLLATPAAPLPQMTAVSISTTRSTSRGEGALVRRRHVTVVVTAAGLLALAPFSTPTTERPTEVAASPRAAARGTHPVAHAASLTADDVDESALSDAPVSDAAELDVVIDPELLSAEAAIQRQLVDLGWTVTVDGIVGTRTRRAIAEFQHANGLPPTGSIDAETTRRLTDPDADGHQRYLADPLPAPTPAPTPAPQVTGAPRPAVDPLIRIEQIADSVGFDWRSRGVTFVIGCHPTHHRCATGSYDTGTRQIFIAERILTNSAVLRSVVLHELAHAWQFNVRGWPAAADDVDGWGRTGIEGLEAAADCLAAAWGASRTYYWSCPADAEAHMLSRYQHG
jgi:hypothetical protein